MALLGDEAGSEAHPCFLVGTGKEGWLYLLDRENLGQWSGTTDDNQIVASSATNAIGGLFGIPAYYSHSIYVLS